MVLYNRGCIKPRLAKLINISKEKPIRKDFKNG